MATRETADPSINRKVAWATVASSCGSLVSIFLGTCLVNLPCLKDTSADEKGAIKASLMAIVTALITLFVGYFTRPGESDGLKPLPDDKGTE